MFELTILSGVVAGLFGYYAVATVAAHRLTQPQRRQPRFTPAALGLVYEDIRIAARGEALTIAAWHIPAPRATRAVIIAHGIGGTRGREFGVSSLTLVEQLVSNGFSVLMLDLRGHGESDAARMTYGLRERRDVLGAVDWLLAHGYDRGAIGVLSLSMGGVAGIGAARSGSFRRSRVSGGVFRLFCTRQATHRAATRDDARLMTGLHGLPTRPEGAVTGVRHSAEIWVIAAILLWL